MRGFPSFDVGSWWGDVDCYGRERSGMCELFGEVWARNKYALSDWYAVEKASRDDVRWRSIDGAEDLGVPRNAR